MKLFSSKIFKAMLLLVALIFYVVDTRSILPRERYNKLLSDLLNQNVVKVEVKFCAAQIFLSVPIDADMFESWLEGKDVPKEAEEICKTTDITNQLLLYTLKSAPDADEFSKIDAMFQNFRRELIGTFVFAMPSFHAYGLPLRQPMASIQGGVIFYLRGGHTAHALYFAGDGMEGAVASQRNFEGRWVLEDVKYVFFANSPYRFLFNQFIKSEIEKMKK